MVPTRVDSHGADFLSTCSRRRWPTCRRSWQPWRRSSERKARSESSLDASPEQSFGAHALETRACPQGSVAAADFEVFIRNSRRDVFAFVQVCSAKEQGRAPPSLTAPHHCLCGLACIAETAAGCSQAHKRHALHATMTSGLPSGAAAGGGGANSGSASPVRTGPSSHISSNTSNPLYTPAPLPRDCERLPAVPRQLGSGT